MAKAAAAGHDVVLVVATRGELGEPEPGVLDDGEPLWQRRVTETHRSGEILGAKQVEFLGFEDSGMMGEATNANPACFWQADLGDAADRLGAILDAAGADILTIYDEHGGYGHPDHIQVHRVGIRAAELAGTPGVFEATMNRDEMIRSMSEAQDYLTPEQLAEMPDLDNTEFEFGVTEDRITHAVDVSGFVDAKRASMRCHRSQIADEDFFLAMPDDGFARAFGVEWYISHRHTRADGEPFLVDLLAE